MDLHRELNYARKYKMDEVIRDLNKVECLSDIACIISKLEIAAVKHECEEYETLANMLYKHVQHTYVDYNITTH